MAISVLVLLLIPQSLFAQDDVEGGRRALARKNYPWYDAESDSVQRIEFQQRPEARSKNRNDIPLADVKPPPTPTNNLNLNMNAGWLEGLGVVVWVVFGILLLLLIGVLVWAFLRLENKQEQDEELIPRRSMADSIKQLPFDIDPTTANFLQLAQAHYAEGDFRQAIVALFSHVLVSLDQKGLVRLRKGKTNRQYLRELGPHRPLASYYQQVMVPFEAAFFGDHDISKQEFEQCWSQLDQFQSGVDNSSQVANV